MIYFVTFSWSSHHVALNWLELGQSDLKLLIHILIYANNFDLRDQNY